MRASATTSTRRAPSPARWRGWPRIARWSSACGATPAGSPRSVTTGSDTRTYCSSPWPPGEPVHPRRAPQDPGPRGLRRDRRPRRPRLPDELSASLAPRLLLRLRLPDTPGPDGPVPLRRDPDLLARGPPRPRSAGLPARADRPRPRPEGRDPPGRVPRHRAGEPGHGGDRDPGGPHLHGGGRPRDLLSGRGHPAARRDLHRTAGLCPALPRRGLARSGEVPPHRRRLPVAGDALSSRRPRAGEGGRGRALPDPGAPGRADHGHLDPGARPPVRPAVARISEVLPRGAGDEQRGERGRLHRRYSTGLRPLSGP